MNERIQNAVLKVENYRIHAAGNRKCRIISRQTIHQETLSLPRKPKNTDQVARFISYCTKYSSCILINFDPTIFA